MSDKFNPFAAWLGMDEENYLPNHFQLFGVKSVSEDPIGFRKKVHTRAKSMLAILEGMSEQEIGDRAKLHVRIRKHVVKAHATLMDDKLRAAYLKQLREKAREGKASQPLATPSPQKPLKPTAVKPSMPVAMKAPAAEAEAAAPAVPMAIPLKNVATPAAPAAGSGSDEPDFSGLASERISIRPRRIKRKQSRLIPVFCVVMAVFGTAILVYLLTNFPTRLNEFLDGKDSQPQPTATNDSETGIADKGADGLRKSVESAVNSRDSVPELKDPGNIKVNMDGVGSGNSEASSSDSDSDSGSGSDSNSQPKPNAGSDTKPAAAAEPESPAAVTLTGPQLHSVRYSLKRAHRAMRRGRLAHAQRMLIAAESQIGGALQGEQSVLQKRLDDSRKFLELVRGFWKQVKSSSRKITVGEVQLDSGRIIGFVEGREQDVVLRFGENVEIPYQSLRPALAIKLAEMNAIKNVSDWRLQKSAFQYLHSQGAAESLQEEIETQIGLSEADGYDVSAIRGYMDQQWLKLIPVPERTASDSSILAELGEKLTAQRYKQVAKVSPSDARKFATAFSTASYDDPLMRIAAIRETVRLSYRAQDAFAMLDAVDELKRWTQIDAAEMKHDGFMRIGRAGMDRDTGRVYGEAFLEFLKSADASELVPKKRDRLRENVIAGVKEMGLVDVRRLIDQTVE